MLTQSLIQKRPRSPSPDPNELSKLEVPIEDITLDISGSYVPGDDVLQLYWDMVEEDISDTAGGITEEECDNLFEVQQFI